MWCVLIDIKAVYGLRTQVFSNIYEIITNSYVFYSGHIYKPLVKKNKQNKPEDESVT